MCDWAFGVKVNQDAGVYNSITFNVGNSVEPMEVDLGGVFEIEASEKI